MVLKKQGEKARKISMNFTRKFKGMEKITLNSKLSQLLMLHQTREF